MNRMLKLCVVAVLMLSFTVVGCPQKDCKDLRAQLLELQNRIISIAQERQQADASGNMSAALELFQQEKNARRDFATLAEKYIAKGCEERTGDVPTLPPMNPVQETEFE